MAVGCLGCIRIVVVLIWDVLVIDVVLLFGSLVFVLCIMLILAFIRLVEAGRDGALQRDVLPPLS